METEKTDKKTILMVDDDRGMLNLGRLLFGEAGFSVITALNGWDCMRVLASGKKPVIVVLDIMMPEVSGYDVYKKIRANPENSAMPVLFYTALPAQELEKIITLSEIDGYAMKSVNMNELVEKVEEMTGKIAKLTQGPAG
jgi:DNA-binding response OmpR family regulator